ncbi:hypothetical protein GC093_11955 [Paenibacillus sp. LMG 31456]|uniref:ABC transporter substrate-binding protein n=1 Tax=Paenibacillus foliorum TaxID=2654974 RepID=A0A972K0K5_9BACL|nr:hypothetical protein [Paenibacillus foliorum]NOU93925.1 hypothetical protein [Paenibacillus foliorum]
MKRAWKASAFTLLSFAVVAGCGPASSPTAAPGTTAPTPTVETKAPTSSEKVTIRFTDWANNEEAKSKSISLKEFEKANPTIKVDYQNVALSEFGAKLSAMAASNTLPDN